jgi:soluble lytic murein transglycosylase-like protein
MRRRRTRSRRLSVLPALVLALSGLGAPEGSTAGRMASSTAEARPAARVIDDLIDEAARRFALPAHWIRAVMKQESGFDPHATSRAGAMGLMQVMPATYAELRQRHGLGPDPYDPRDNILAGAAYLRELHDRFGSAGMLAAYNAGPGRYLQHRDEGRPLPAETRVYVARIGRLDAPPNPSTQAGSAASVSIDPAHAPLFPEERTPGEPRLPGLFVSLTSDQPAYPGRPR